MTSEQLQSARAEQWRQTANPIVTADDARAWVEGIGLCLFLPRRAHFSAPAPSLVEAVAGRLLDTPSREQIEYGTELLHRLTAEGVVVPLNLFHAGGFGAAVFGGADQPDFVVTREALPYVFSLIGGRNWKSGPGDKASPLMREIWALLNEKGASTIQEIQTALGRELTEAAVLRGLVELWGGLRAIPVYDGETTRWELTQARFAAEMTASQKVAQTTALSALVSFYLQAVIAASSEQVETFLSTLAGRSRIREVVNGLQATRQLGLVSVNAQPLVHVAGALPEFAEAEPVETEARENFERSAGLAAGAAMLDRGRREESRKTFERRPRDLERRTEGGERRPYARSGKDGDRGPRRPFDKERRAEGGERGRGDGARFGKKRFDSGSRGFGGRERGEERRERGEFRGGKFPPKKFGRGGGERPWQERGERRPHEKPAAHREEGGRKIWERDRGRVEDRDRKRGGERGGESRFERGRERRADERGGERRPGRFSGGKKFGGGKFSGEKRFGGPKKFGGQRFEGEKRFGGPKKFGSRGPSKEFDREKRPPYRERESERSAERGSRSESRGGTRFEQRGERGPRQGKPEFRGSGKPKFGGKNFGERGDGKSGYKKSGFGSSGKPFEKSGKKFGKTQRPGGAKRQSGFKPPFRKRKDKDSESGE